MIRPVSTNPRRGAWMGVLAAIATGVALAGCSLSLTTSATPLPTAPSPQPGITFPTPTTGIRGGELVGAVGIGDMAYAAFAFPDRQARWGQSTAIGLSLDGLNWAEANTGAVLQDTNPIGLVAVAGRLVLVANRNHAEGDILTAGSVTFYSDDGRHWQPGAADASLATDDLALLVATPGGAVAVGRHPDGAPAIWHTSDGGTWEAVEPGAAFGSDGEQAQLAALDTISGRFVLGGLIGPADAQDPGRREPAVWTSADGARWERVSLGLDPGTDGDVNLLLRTPGGLLARVFTGSDSSPHVLLTTNDGVTWTRISASVSDLPAFDTRTACTATMCVMLGPADAQPAAASGVVTPSGSAHPDTTTAVLSTDVIAWRTVPIYGTPPTILVTPPRVREPSPLGYVLTRMVVLDERFIAVGTNGQAGVFWPLTITP